MNKPSLRESPDADPAPQPLAASPERPTLHVLLPSQQVARRGVVRSEPQRRLMAAVLRTVLDDCQAEAGVAGDPHRYWQARAYVESTDRTWPFSFDNICDALGLDAQRVRRELIRLPA